MRAFCCVLCLATVTLLSVHFKVVAVLWFLWQVSGPLRCLCVADTSQAAPRSRPSAARLLYTLLTRQRPSFPPRPLTSLGSSTTATAPESARLPPPLCLGASAEPSASARCPLSPGQVTPNCFYCWRTEKKSLFCSFSFYKINRFSYNPWV